MGSWEGGRAPGKESSPGEDRGLGLQEGARPPAGMQVCSDMHEVTHAPVRTHTGTHTSTCHPGALPGQPNDWGAPTRHPHWVLPVRAEYFPFFPSLLPALARSARPESLSPSNSYWTCQCALPVPWLNPTLTPSFHLHTGPGTRDSPRPRLSPSGVRDKISWSLEHLCP